MTTTARLLNVDNFQPSPGLDTAKTPEPAGVSWVVTDTQGVLLDASQAAAAMLNLSVWGLRSRQLLVFFDAEREQWQHALRAAAGGLLVEREGVVRPRERRPMPVRVEIAKANDWTRDDALLWTFLRPELPDSQED